MIRVALTGSIGAGKTTLLEAARTEGYPVFNADKAVHQLYSDNHALIREIGESFPGSVSDGAIDKAVLTKLIYEGNGEEVKKAARKLRRLVSPYVLQKMYAFFEEAETKSSAAVCEIPFLFESGLYRAFDLTVNLAISDDVQRARVLKRDSHKGMDVTLLAKIKGLFFSEAVRKRLADVNLDANSTADTVFQEFLNVLKDVGSQNTGRANLRQRPPLVWLVGTTSSGKTPIAQKGISPLGFHAIMASQFFRESFGKQETDYLEGMPVESFSAKDIADLKKKFVRDLAAHSVSILQDNPHCNVDYVSAAIHHADMPCVLEGFRNPFEFMQIYDPAKDMVIFLDRTNAPRYDTVFERGIEGIKQNVRWCIDASLTPEGAIYDIKFSNSQIEVLRLVKEGKTEKVLSEQLEDADDYELIDKIIIVAPKLVADYYARNGLLLRPSQRQEISQRQFGM